MLTIYRRHVKTCDHKHEGRKYRRCRCPIWVDGSLKGVEMRESLELRDWEKAQQTIRKWEAEGAPKEEQPQQVGVESACEEFLREAETRGLREPTLKKYRVLFKQMKAYASQVGALFLKQWDLEVLRKFRQSWADQGISAVKKLERLRAFFRFALESKWIEENPSTKLRKPEVMDAPTMPFTQDEVVRILAACEHYTDNYGNTGQVNAKRLRALVLLLRYSGMRIGDAASCSTERITGDRLFLYTHKTNAPVSCKLPLFVVDELRSVPTLSSRYFFWTGEGKVDTVAGNYRRSLRRLFTLAGIKGGHPHRFRDTFAVELLLSGVPLERVSVLLGHRSIKVTEKHYTPWVRARQEQLESDQQRSWERDPIVLAQMKGTSEVHEKMEVVN